jgi:hypothetical protein
LIDKKEIQEFNGQNNLDIALKEIPPMVNKIVNNGYLSIDPRSQSYDF